MKKFIRLMALLPFACLAQTNYTTGIDLSIIDRNADPKKDLMRFAAGKWMDEAKIPDADYSWGSFSEIKERNEKNLHVILDELLGDKTLKAGTEKKKLQDFYRLSLDTVKLNKEGIKPLAKEFAAIDAIKTKAELFKSIAKLQSIGVNCVFTFYVYADLKESKKNSSYLAQGGLALPSKDFYLSDNYKSIQDAYLAHITRSFELMKMYPESASANASAVYAVEKQIAKGCASLVELRDVEKQYNKMSAKEVKAMAPEIDFNTYFTSLGVKMADTFIVSQPEFLKHLSELMKSVTMKDWKLYLKWFLLREYQPFLSDDMVRENFSFNGTVLTGVKQMKPRWKKAIAVTDMAMGEALGKIFVSRHFDENAKKRVNTMVDNLIAAFKDRVASRPWMSEPTKKAAMTKLDKIYRKLGFPDKWEDYSQLNIGTDSYAANMMRVNKWRMKKMLEKMGKPVDRDKWGMSPPTVNAYYNPGTNEIAFPAGIMQPPFFDPNADDAFNYGIMGAVIGHELSHGFDDEGSKFDGDGNLVTWWAKEDVDKFEQLTKPLVNQFNAYVAIDTFHVNGSLTLGENIGDLGGLTMAYYGYKKSLNGKKSDVRDGFTGEQRFFLAWAQGWKVKMRDAFLKQMVSTNPHSPGYFRAIGSPSNMPEFYEAFDVKPGDGMYRAENVRVSIW